MQLKVNRNDGTCRECKGTLLIIDADDIGLTVECQKCGEVYDVETDAFHDGGITYWPEAMVNKMEEEGW